MKNYCLKKSIDVFIIALKLGLKSFTDNEQFLELSNSEYDRYSFADIPSLCTDINLKGISFCIKSIILDRNKRPQMIR